MQDNLQMMQSFRDKLKSQMQIRFGDVASHILLSVVTVLDPRYKKNGFTAIRCYEKAANALNQRIGTVTVEVIASSITIDEPA